MFFRYLPHRGRGPVRPRHAHRPAVNACGLVQGIALVTFLAASTIFTALTPYDLSSSQYGDPAAAQPQTAQPGRVQSLGAGLAEGLGAIHARGLVHRDLKPGNVILAADGPRIIDFGIARAVGEMTLTTAGMVVGTFAYMSPEQIRGEVAGPPSDVFSLGCLLAFAATGRPPFGGDSAVTVMFGIVNEPPDLAGLADHELAGLISGCLAKAPEARPTPPGLRCRWIGTARPTTCSTTLRSARNRAAAPSQSTRASAERR